MDHNETLNYIKNNWQKTFHESNEDVPYPYTSPSISEIVWFYYWDNYFIHKGLMLDGFGYQVKNNLDNFAYFINKTGYMPNSSVLTDRSQPPLFAKCVWEYYLFVQDISVIEEYLPTILKEYDFWMTQRMLPCGLNTYSCNATEKQLLFAYDTLCDRVLEYRDSEREKIALARDILAVAESGLDFNMRFKTERSKIDAGSFIHIDLTCIMYDVERIISKMYSLTGNDEKSDVFNLKAEKRKSLIDELLFDKDTGLYLDYDFVDKRFSETVTAVSFYPFTFGVSDDVLSAKKLLSRLELENGLCVGEYRGENAIYYQWDYPCMWPAATCFAYMGLNNIGLKEDAARIAGKYVCAVDKNFKKTGILWEKYNAVTGDIGYSDEYETPEMLGWTAAVYRYFIEEENTIRS